MDIDSLSSTVATSLAHLMGAAAEFVHCAASDQPESHTLSKYFTEDSTITDQLRTLRHLVAHLPQFHPQFSDPALFLMDTAAKLTDLADSLLLLIYKDNRMSIHWHSATPSIQENVLLALSVLLQSLSNVLSALRFLNSTPPTSRLQSILTVLLSCCRGNLLLTSAVEHPLHSIHLTHLWRLNSHTSFVLFMTLIEFHKAISHLGERDFIFVYTNLLLSSDVFSSLCNIATDQTACEDTLLQARRLHYQLLLGQLAKFLNQFHPAISLAHSCASLSIRDICAATGIALQFQQNADEVGSISSSQENVRSVIKTVRPCLLFWRHFVLSMKCIGSDLAMSTLLSLLQAEYNTWFLDLSSCFTKSNSTPTTCTQQNSPYILLRGLVHILSEVAFSTAQFDNPTTLEPLISPCTLSGLPGDRVTNVGDVSAQRNNFYIDFTEASQLWGILCNILVLLGFIDNHIDSTSKSVELHSKEAWGEPCSVIPSRISKAEPLLDSASPFSLRQAIGFKHDCIRCMVGLLSQFPSLSSQLASHRLDRLPLDPPPSVSCCAFDHLLNATNRDSVDPLCCEWAILATKLVLNPITETPDALEGAQLLAKRLEAMQLIR